MTVTQIPKLYTEAQTAEQLSPADGPKISKYTVRRLRLAGALGYVRIGKRIFHREDQIRAYIDAQSTERACPNDKNPSGSSSANTGSQGGKTPPPGAGPGSTRAAGKLDALRLAQETLNRRKSDSPSGTLPSAS